MLPQVRIKMGLRTKFIIKLKVIEGAGASIVLHHLQGFQPAYVLTIQKKSYTVLSHS
jgi:hypothetical protein